MHFCSCFESRRVTLRSTLGKLLSQGALATFLLVAQAARAEWPSTPAAFAALPPYCKARWADQGSPERVLWGKRLGKGFNHVHHYCGGLHEINLSYRAKNNKERRRLLSHAVQQIEYVEKLAPADFPLRAEMAAKKRQVLMQLATIPSS